MDSIQTDSSYRLRHTFATKLANSEVSVYTLMKLLGHEFMITSRRYITAAGTETRTAAAQNYRRLRSRRRSTISTSSSLPLSRAGLGARFGLRPRTRDCHPA
jgi:hypothetical protein